MEMGYLREFIVFSSHMNVSKAARALHVSQPTLSHHIQALEKYFGSRYPYEKLDLIAVPEYWYGAMENPGLITFVDRVLLLDQKTASSAATTAIGR